jgi:SAM-dependent methyltransferase
MVSKNFVYRDVCPLCNSNQELKEIFSYLYTNDGLFKFIKERYPKIRTEHLYELPFTLMHCTDCDLFFQRYIPSDDFYWNYLYQDENVTKIPKRQNSNPLYYVGKAREVEKISVFLKKLPSTVDVLEFGSGFGHWLLLAKAYGHNAFGIEIKKERVEYSRASGLSVYYDLSELPVGQQFDFIFSEAVFEHVSDPVPYVKELSDLLKPGGVMVLSIPYGLSEKANKKSIREYEGDDHIPKVVDPLEHVNVFTNKSIRKLGLVAGLEPISIMYAIKCFLKSISKTQNLHNIQELVKFIFKQKYNNTVYFKK